MPQLHTLHIALQEGFAGQPVAISVDGREIYRKDAVRTRMQIGLADSIETQHEPGIATVEVKAGSSSATLTPTLTQDLYLGISIGQDGRITHRSSTQRFGYM
jgi:hypothetical protein